MKVPMRSLVALVLVVAVAGAAAWGARKAQRAYFVSRIAEAARPGDIWVFSASWCEDCAVAQQWLEAHSIPAQACDIDLDEACAAQFHYLRGKGMPLLMVYGQTRHGLDRAWLANALERRGNFGARLRAKAS